MRATLARLGPDSRPEVALERPADSSPDKTAMDLGRRLDWPRSGSFWSCADWRGVNQAINIDDCAPMLLELSRRRRRSLNRSHLKSRLFVLNQLGKKLKVSPLRTGSVFR